MSPLFVARHELLANAVRHIKMLKLEVKYVSWSTDNIDDVALKERRRGIVRYQWLALRHVTKASSSKYVKVKKNVSWVVWMGENEGPCFQSHKSLAFFFFFFPLLLRFSFLFLAFPLLPAQPSFFFFDVQCSALKAATSVGSAKETASSLFCQK